MFPSTLSQNWGQNIPSAIITPYFIVFLPDCQPFQTKAQAAPIPLASLHSAKKKPRTHKGAGPTVCSAAAAVVAATAAIVAAASAATPTAAAAAPDDNQQNDDPAAISAATAAIITTHIRSSYEIEM